MHIMTYGYLLFFRIDTSPWWSKDLFTIHCILTLLTGGLRNQPHGAPRRGRVLSQADQPLGRGRFRGQDQRAQGLSAANFQPEVLRSTTGMEFYSLWAVMELNNWQTLDAFSILLWTKELRESASRVIVSTKNTVIHTLRPCPIGVWRDRGL